MKQVFNYIYGPVPSWRLGSSLGIDLLSQKEKICNFNCVYCQLGSAVKYTVERKIYVPVGKVIEELESMPNTKIDYITFSGRGEPILAKNLGEAIKAIKLSRKVPVAVLTNSTLLYNDEVKKELSLADFVVAKLDAFSTESLQEINRSAKAIKFKSILEGIREFKKGYQGKLALQIMFIEQNKKHASEIARIAREINPDEVQINTPLRPCRVNPLPKQELDKIKTYFEGLNVVSVYEAEIKKVKPVSNKDTLKRRGKV
ncbi:MAG: radical SAM protein [Clostridiales bacterium]|nr:radical SAM protein [bacterium]MCK5128300.1 radical SAM protein [Clostridiales bacterium]